MQSLSALVPRLAGLRVVVIGDLTLDEYLYGRATRLSREAAVPVLEFQRREHILGGAANPARNIVALGSHASLVGIVGADHAGQELRDLLRQVGITDTTILCPSRPTTRKTRILADQSPRLPQQLARIDELDRRPLKSEDEERILSALRTVITQADLLICSDYQLGLLSRRIVDAARQLCREHGVLFCVDAQGNSHYYREADLFRCNDTEAAAALGAPLHSEADFAAGLEQLLTLLDAQLVIVTRGPDGLAIMGKDLVYTHLPAVQVSEVYDTTGAGDTFIAVASLSLAAGLSALEAAQLANTAAALVVRRLGNAVVTPEELAAATSH